MYVYVDILIDSYNSSVYCVHKYLQCVYLHVCLYCTVYSYICIYLYGYVCTYVRL